MRLPRPGLRGRVVATVVLVALATLLVADLTLLPPLQHRLEADRVDALVDLARTARPAVASLGDVAGGEDRGEARRLVSRLRRRAGGEVALLGERDGVVLATTDPALDHVAPLGDAVGRGDVVGGTTAGAAEVVTRVRTRRGAPVRLVLRKPLGDARAASDAVRRSLPLAGGVGLAAAVLLALLASGGVVRRLARLREDAVALGEEGLAHRVATDARGDEVAEVARALESMRARLLREEAGRQAFLATASHELRTPLAALQGTLEVVRERLAAPGADPAAEVERLDRALRQTGRLTTLAGDLLDLARLDAEADVRPEPTELVELAEGVAAEAGPGLAARGRAVVVEGAGEPVHALADPVAARRVLWVLVDNATAYGAGTVRVAVARAGDRARVVVADAGPGLSDADRELVFERFRRGSAGSRRAGFGLGLPIARGLAERLGGTLTAARPARGAAFVLELPAWEPVAAPPRTRSGSGTPAGASR